jgi:beta-barrel assembly-enhancing protease
MYKRTYSQRIVAVTFALAVWISPIAAVAQTTTVQPPKNKYSVQDDIKLGNDAARQVERQFPIINDADATEYIERVGQRLVDGIPSTLRNNAFNYRFKWVNARDINAFALPGGPMYVNRGMIESARNEGEMAGVMAHEISHVALRHATAQATKQSSAKNTLGTIGLILGGAIVGGQAGAQLGAMGAAAWMTKYSREYETQADSLGAQIMANAGYDPHDLANVFQTIAQESRGGGGPEWLSSHPDPGNRYQKINQMANSMRIAPNPTKVTVDFQRTRERFRSMPRARSMAEIEKGAPAGNSGGYGNDNGSYSTGRYSNNVQYPSSQYRTANLGWLEISVPSNWRDNNSGTAAEFAPEGAYGDQGITHGVMVGTYQSQNGRSTLAMDSQAYVTEVLQNNSYLRQRTSLTRANVAGRSGYIASLFGRSPVTGRTELVTIYTAQLRSGETMYITTVVPEAESSSYYQTFRNVINSIRTR